MVSRVHQKERLDVRYDSDQRVECCGDVKRVMTINLKVRAHTSLAIINILAEIIKLVQDDVRRSDVDNSRPESFVD
jgi:hypothetical protein